MSWAKFDDRYDDGRKVKKAWRRHPRAIGLHAMAITYCARHETDGMVDPEWIAEKLPVKRERDAALAALVDAGLFEACDDGWYRVHDYLDYNDTRATLQERRRRDAERKARGGAKSRPPDGGGTPAGGGEDAGRTPDGIQAESGSPDPTRPDQEEETPPSPGGDMVPARLDEARERLQAGATQRVFDAWIESTGRTGRTVLDAKRRRLISAALKGYPEDEVVDAVRGWRHSPHHRGENDRHTVFNELELLLRDSKQIEKFRDLERGHRPTGVRSADLHRAMSGDAA